MEIEVRLKLKRISATKEDLDAAGVTHVDITDKTNIRHIVFDWKVNLSEKRKNTRTVWSDGRKRAGSEGIQHM